MIRTAGELKDAIKARAVAYAFIYDEMREKLGEAKACKIFSNGIYKFGRSKNRKYKEALSQGGFKKLAELFVSSSPLGGRVFRPKIEKVKDEECILIMKSCPLVEAWKGQKFSNKKIKNLCDIAYQIDLGTFESCGLNIKFSHRIGAGDKFCRMLLNKK